MKPKIMKPTTVGLRMGDQEAAIALVDVIKVNESERRVDAKTLHKWLGAKSAFRHWIKRRIEDCRLEENVDFWAVKKDRVVNIGVFEEFWLSFDAAKLVSMIERTDKGNEARRYFVAVEEKFFKVRDELIPALKAENERLSGLLAQATKPKITRRKGEMRIKVWEIVRTHSPIFGLVHEDLIQVSRPYTELTDVEKLSWRTGHRQAVMTGLSLAQSDDLKKLTLVPAAGLVKTNKGDLS